MSYSSEHFPYIKIPKTVNVYRLTSAQYDYLIQHMSDIDVGIGTETYLTGSNFYQGITAVLQIPSEFADASVGNNVTQIDSGMWSMRSDNTLAEKLVYRFGTSGQYFIEVPMIHSNYLDYSNTHVSLHVPFCEPIELDPSMTIGHRINFEYRLDWCTGEGCVWVYNENLLIATKKSTIGSSVPLSSAQGDLVRGAWAKFFSSGALSFVPMLDMVSNGWLKSTSQASAGNLGESNFMSSMKGWIRVTTCVEPLDDLDRADVMGLPENAVIGLSNLSNYVKVLEVHTDGISATDEEKREIESLLKSGVYVKGWS